jgi:hypothetical protein
MSDYRRSFNDLGAILTTEEQPEEDNTEGTEKSI